MHPKIFGLGMKTVFIIASKKNFENMQPNAKKGDYRDERVLSNGKEKSFGGYDYSRPVSCAG